jgi:two-component system sensor histidine kinase ChvG
MAPATDSPRSDGGREVGDLALRWSGQISLTQRILAVNIVALGLLAGGFFYLDSFRSRILDYRVAQSLREARLIGEALNTSAPRQREALLARLAADTGLRIRVIDSQGRMVADSRALGVRTFVLVDPDKEGWSQAGARFLDA